MTEDRRAGPARGAPGAGRPDERESLDTAVPVRRSGVPWIDDLRGRVAERPGQRTGGRVWAAVALVLVPREGAHPADPRDLELLLIERARREGDPWSGHMGLPGGRWEPADADALVTAMRETREETGIALSERHLIAELDDYVPMWRPNADLVVRSFVFALPARPLTEPSDEVAQVLWTSLAGLAACACRAEVDLRGTPIEVDAFRCGPHVVWGMTHRILCGLLERLC